MYGWKKMKKFIILIPIYNDWESVSRLVSEMDVQITDWDATVSILIINDSSTQNKILIKPIFKKIKSIKIVNMRKNVGHARCYATAFKYIMKNEDFDYAIPMDGDGEDRPEELNLLFKKASENPAKTITADRVERSEGVFFKLLYECHKILTFIFTGKFIKFGNYSLLTKEAVTKLIREPSIWSSFSGSVTKIIFNKVSVNSIRGNRYYGPSKMNFFDLLNHSFSIMAVFKISVIIRSLLFLIFYIYFIFSAISLVTLLPVIAILIFLFLIIKISSRENIDELNNSLENIDSIDNLDSFNNRQ